MYGTATFQTSTREALTVARDAVVDTGLEQHVFVVEHPGHYVPRRVEVGALLGDRIEIRSGLKEGDSVVASGVFLIDSESRLRASGGGEMAGMKMDGPHPATAPAQSSHSGHGG
jgi:Cu(I)/Ag(I) efflux system membrane fusion protein